MAKKNNKKRKRGGAMVHVPRGGFTTPTWGRVRNDAFRYMRHVLKSSTGADYDKIHRLIKDMSMPKKAELKQKIIGLIKATGEQYISGSSGGDTPFTEVNTYKSAMLGSQKTQVYHTKFEYGKPSTGPIRTLARLHGTSKVTYRDTQYDASYGGVTAGRNTLSHATGFNRKIILQFLRWQYLTDMIFQNYELGPYRTAANKVQTNYACVKNMWREIKIMHNSRYVDAKYTIKLYRTNAHNFDSSTSFTRAFHTTAQLTAGVQIEDKIPIKFQLSGYQDDGSGNATRVWVDPKVSLTNAPEFGQDHELVKSFSKVLSPGDVWCYREKFHCGSGINLDELFSQHQQNLLGYMGYMLVVECQGKPVQACLVEASGFSNENFIGTAPAYFQLEFKNGHESVNAALNIDTYNSSITTGGVDSNKFMIRSFTDHRNTFNTNQKIFNRPISQIADDPSLAVPDDIFIPIMTDTNVQYAQRRREGGTGGEFGQ